MSATSGGSAPRIFASGATHHMTFDHSVLTCCSPVSDFTYIYIAHSTPLAATQSDNITLTFDSSGRLILSSALRILKLTMQLISVEKITDNCNILFTPTSCIFQDYTGRKNGISHKVNDLYQLEYLHIPSSPHPAVSLSVPSDL